MGISIWRFRRVPDFEFGHVPAPLYRRFYFGRARFSPEPDGYVRIAEIEILFRHRKAIDIGVSWYPRHRVGRDGLIDLAHRADSERLRDEMRRRQGGRRGSRDRGAPIVGEAHLLERRIRNLHAWELNDDDVHAFAAAIDRRAGRQFV